MPGVLHRITINGNVDIIDADHADKCCRDRGACLTFELALVRTVLSDAERDVFSTGSTFRKVEGEETVCLVLYILIEFSACHALTGSQHGGVACVLQLATRHVGYAEVKGRADQCHQHKHSGCGQSKHVAGLIL